MSGLRYHVPPPTEPTPVWVYIARTNARIAEECERAGITAPSLMLTAATRSPWQFVDALREWGIQVPTAKPGYLPVGVIEAKAPYLVDEVRRHGVLLARPSHGTPWAEIDTAGNRVVAWASLGGRARQAAA
ncbi:MAG TPA: hypothetical protein VIW24_27950 [Aldersonia sp.]